MDARRARPARSLKTLVAWSCLAWLAPAVGSTAEGADRPAEVAAVRALGERYLEALRKQEADAYRELHALYRERCEEGDDADAYEEMLAFELRSRPAEDAELSVSPVDRDALDANRVVLKATAGVAVRYPDPPAYAIDVNLEGYYPKSHPCYAPGAVRRVRKYVARRGDQFYLAPACLTDVAIAELRASRRNERAVHRMQESLYAKLDPELHSELRDLVESHRGEEAVERYRAETGASRGAAVRLVERICEDF